MPSKQKSPKAQFLVVSFVIGQLCVTSLRSYPTTRAHLVGLERFELSSIAPEATSLDQASRQPHNYVLGSTVVWETVK